MRSANDPETQPATFVDLAAACPDPVFVMDAQARLLFVNEAGARMLGRPSTSLVGSPQDAVFPEPIAARHAAAVREVVATGETRDSENRDLRGLWLETRLRPVKDAQGEVVAIIGISRDVSARHAVHESERRYRATVEHANIGIANLALDGRFVGVNERLCAILGRAAADLLHVSLRDVLAPDEPGDFNARLRELSAGRGASFAREARCLRRDGSGVWVHAALSLIRDDGDQPAEIVAILEDVSARRLLEERLRQAEKLEAIGQLAGGVAHDFNNQLTAIIGYADLLLSKLSEDSLKRYATNILESAKRSADLTRQLLAFARKGQFQRAAVDVHALLREVANILERSIDKRIRVETILRDSAPLVVGDASLLQSALLNLALNARDAMPDGGRLGLETDTVMIGSGARGPYPPELGPGTYVAVAVSDTGCGMSESVMGRLFEPFFTTKEPGKGTGLGLAAVFGTIQRHGGAITVSSAPGHGSSFRVYLPAIRPAAAEDAAASAETKALTSGRVLLIDDERLVRDLTSEMLTAEGFVVETKDDGRAGVEHYQRHWRDIDLVILDLVMPEMHGTEVFGWLRRINPTVRVLLASGYTSDGDAQSLLARGAIGFIQKPFDRALLLRRVNEALTAPLAVPRP